MRCRRRGLLGGIPTGSGQDFTREVLFYPENVINYQVVHILSPSRLWYICCPHLDYPCNTCVPTLYSHVTNFFFFFSQIFYTVITFDLHSNISLTFFHPMFTRNYGGQTTEQIQVLFMPSYWGINIFVLDPSSILRHRRSPSLWQEKVWTPAAASNNLNTCCNATYIPKVKVCVQPLEQVELRIKRHKMSVIFGVVHHRLELNHVNFWRPKTTASEN